MPKQTGFVIQFINIVNYEARPQLEGNPEVLAKVIITIKPSVDHEEPVGYVATLYNFAESVNLYIRFIFKCIKCFIFNFK